MKESESEEIDIQKRLLEIFEANREEPGSGYDNEKFIQYLVARNEETPNIHNCFKGKRFFNKYIKEVENTFSVCFSNKDLDTIVGLEKMANRIAYLKKTPKSSLTTISNRLRERFNPAQPAVIIVISLPIIGISLKLFSYYGILSLGIPLVLSLAVYRLFIREKKHYLNLRNRINRTTTEEKCSQ